MILALSALLGAGLTAAACYAIGVLLIDRLGITLFRFERIPLGFTLGAACLHLLVFAILTLHLAYWPVFALALCAAIAAAVVRGSWRLQGEVEKPISQNLKRICILLFGAFTILYFFHAWAPEMSPDGSGYHLGYVARYLRAHGFERITTDMYAALSEGIEMIFVPAFAIGQHSAAALIHLIFTASLALAIFAYGRRVGKPWVGAAAAFLTYASPIVGIDGASAYNDLGVAAVAFSAFYWLEIWDATRDRAALVPIGLMSGYAYATKYTACLMLLFAVGFVLMKARRLRPAATVLLFSSLMIAPWMLKNWIILRNPVAPFGNTIFRNPYFHPIFETEYTHALQDYGVADKRTLPLEVTIRGDKTQGLLGLIFLAAPIALLSLRFQSGRRMLLLALLLALPYYYNIGTRFLIPSLPFISLSMALAIGSYPAVLAAVMIFHGFFSWPSEIRRYSRQYVWRLDRVQIPQALRLIPQDRYLRSVSQEYSAARMVEATVPKGERILATAGVPYAYCNRDFLVSYQAALNQTLMDTIDMGFVRDYQPTVTYTFRFPERRVRRIRVIETAKMDRPDVEWAVHEMRFLYKGVELPRRPEWRLRAWPNPWEAQLAFDNSLATRWRSWEEIKPGAYLDVDFGKEEAIDEVLLDAAPFYEKVQTQVEALDQGGTWRVLAKDPKADLADRSHYSIRLAATYELKARGIHYLLVGDDYSGVDDIRDDPAAWGLTQAASGYGIRIYKVNE